MHPAIVAVTEADFVQALVMCRTAGNRYIAYLCHQITRLAPSLRQACQQLQEQSLAPLDLQRS